MEDIEKLLIEHIISKNIGFDVCIKEMSKEEFKEEEHPRASDGKFRNKNSASTPEVKSGENKTSLIKKSALGLGILIGTIGGYKLFSRTNIFQWAAKNNKNPKEIVGIVLGGAKLGGKITKTSQDIVNLNISRKYFKKDQYLLPNEKKVFNYLNNPTEMQKDILESFGHLDFEFNCKKILLSNKMPFAFPENYDEFLKCSTNYNIGKNEITAHVPEMAIINDILKLTPKQIIVHEYAHALAFNNSSLMIKHEKEFSDMASSLMGKKVYIANMKDLSKPLEGKITNVKIVDLDLEKEFKKAFDQMKDMGIRANYKDLEKYRKIKTKTVQMTILNKDGIEEVTMWDKMLQLQGMGMSSFNADSFFKIEGHSHRQLYGLRELSEYIAIKAERGEKI